MTPSVLFHIGAHKTGSTHLQATLLANRAVLKEAGMVFRKGSKVPRLRRDTIALRGAAERGDEAAWSHWSGRLRKRLRSAVSADPETRAVVVSYEGLLGSMDFAASRGIYPQARRIMQALHSHLPKGAAIAISTREYAGLLSSSYKFRVRRGLETPFPKWLKHTALKRFAWRQLVEAAIAVFGAERVVVWSFEAYTKDLDGFFTWLSQRAGTPLEPARLRIDPEPRNPSASAKALQIERAVNRAIRKRRGHEVIGEDLLYDIHVAIEEKLPKNVYPAPVFFDEEQRKELAARYDRDMESVAALLPPEHFFHTPPAA